MTSMTIDATFDGTVFRPTTPVAIAPNTEVRLTIETVPISQKAGEPYSFLKVARSMKLKGPANWSSNLHQELYGEGCRGDE